jgi:hypothetical protein
MEKYGERGRSQCGCAVTVLWRRRVVEAASVVGRRRWVGWSVLVSEATCSAPLTIQITSRVTRMKILYLVWNTPEIVWR